MESDESDGERTIKKTTGPADHFITTYTDGVWGFTESYRGQWQDLESGDVVLFHSTAEDTDGNRWEPGIIGYGIVGSTSTKDAPLWRSEKRDESNDWPFLVWFSETRWRGEVDRIENRPIESKSVARVHEEIEALLDDALPLGAVDDALDYRFPVQAAFSGISHESEILDLVEDADLTRVHYRDRETVDRADESESERATSTVERGDATAALTVSFDGDDLFDGLYFPREERETLANKLESALNAGKHVILTGPPGTGKTELAENVCRALQETGLYTGYHVTTATADWSTFDTVGGYMPEASGDGSLDFTPGQVLRRFATGGAWRNEPLVVDEINRADIDKAFGQLFTLLSGQRVQLPFEEDGTEVELLPAGEHEPGRPLEEHEYLVPDSWRLLATMNSYDKTSLYEMSYAFMRRFAFVRVPVPDLPDDREGRAALVDRYVDRWSVDPDREDTAAVADVWWSMNRHGREIGPALVRDMLAAMTRTPARSVEARVTEAVASYVLPQLEGVPDRESILRGLLGDAPLARGRLAAEADEMLRTDLADG